MSLSTRLAEVRADLKPFISNPGWPKQEILVDRVVASPQRLGVAFDYLVRFGLANRYDAVAQPTKAEWAAGMGEDWGRNSLDDLEAVHGAVEEVREGTRADRLDKSTGEAGIVLAAYELLYRSQRPETVDVPPRRDEVAELMRLFEIVPWDEFQPTERLMLNPGFGEGSEVLGGADADIVLDDVVIEIKTVSNKKPNLEMIRQAVCYALLANRFGLNREKMSAGIDQIGFYLARSGSLLTCALSDCVDPEDHDAVLNLLLPQ